MSKESTTIKLIIYLFKLFRGAVRLLPTRFALKSGRAFGYFVSFFIPKEEAISVAQLQFAGLAKSRKEAVAIFRDSLTHIGESIVEILISDRIVNKIGKFDELQLKLKPALEGRGGIILTGHLGNFELAAAYFLKQGCVFQPVGRIPNFESLRHIVEYVRERNNVETLWREDRDSSVRMVKMLRNNEAIAALIDQDTSLDSIYVPFFGHLARTPSAQTKIAFRYELPIYSCFTVRTSMLQYEIYAEEINYDKEDSDAAYKILETYHKRLEDLVRRYPEQWIWWHRRWRRRPENDDGKIHTKNSKQYIQWLIENTNE